METKENDLLIDNIKEGYYRYYNLPSYKIIKSNFPKKEYQETFEIRQTSEDVLKKILEKRKEESGINIIFSKEAIEKLSKKPTERITTIEEEKRKQLTEEIEEIKRKWEEEKKKQIEKIISPYDIPQKKPENLIIIEDENKEQRFTPIKYVSLPITKKKIQEESQRTPSPFERFHGGLLLQQTPQTTETPKITEEKESKGLIETISSIFKRKPQKEKEITETPQESPQRKSWELSGLLSSIFSKKPTEKIVTETKQKEISKFENKKEIIKNIDEVKSPESKSIEETSISSPTSEEKLKNIPEKEIYSQKTVATKFFTGKYPIYTPLGLGPITSLIAEKRIEYKMPDIKSKEGIQEKIQTEEEVESTDKLQEKKENIPGITYEERMKIRRERLSRRLGSGEERLKKKLEQQEKLEEKQENQTPIEKITKETMQEQPFTLPISKKFKKEDKLTEETKEVSQEPRIFQRLFGRIWRKKEETTLPTTQIIEGQTIDKDTIEQIPPKTTIFGKLWGGMTSLFKGKTTESTTNKLQEEKMQEKTDKQVSTPSFTEEKPKQSITQDTDSKTEEKEKKEQSPVSSPEEKRNIKEQFEEQTSFNIYDLFKTTPTQKIQQETKKTDETLKHIVGYGGSLASGLVGSLLFGAWGIPISIIGSAVSSALGRAISGDKDIMKGEDLIKHIAVGTGTSLVGLLIRHLMSSNKEQKIKGKIRKITTRRIRR
ncbi:MAG: hypothetical protein ACO2O4_05305 [Minisyncoccia bacterium]